MGRCTLCRGVGWVLDCNDIGKPGPRMLEFIECPIPDCGSSGQPVQNVSFAGVKFGNTSRHPAGGYVMSVSA